jgi:hypothetical protein
MSAAWNLSIEIPAETAAWLQDRADRFFHGNVQDAAVFVFKETMRREEYHDAVLRASGSPPVDPWAAIVAEARKRRQS